MNDSTTKTKPWDFRPLGCLARLGAYVGVVILFLLMLYALVGAVVFPFVAFDQTTSPGVLRSVGLVLAWAGIICVACLIMWGFTRLNRRLDLSRYEKKCNGDDVYFLSGSLFRPVSGVGKMRFAEGTVILHAPVGPNLLVPLLIIVGVNVVSAVVIASGGQGVIIGGMGAVVVLIVYNYLLKQEKAISLGRSNIASARFNGPILKLTFRNRPLFLLARTSIFFPSQVRLSALKGLEASLPGLLPEEYRSALANPSCETTCS